MWADLRRGVLWDLELAEISSLRHTSYVKRKWQTHAQQSNKQTTTQPARTPARTAVTAPRSCSRHTTQCDATATHKHTETEKQGKTGYDACRKRACARWWWARWHELSISGARAFGNTPRGAVIGRAVSRPHKHLARARPLAQARGEDGGSYATSDRLLGCVVATESQPEGFSPSYASQIARSQSPSVVHSTPLTVIQTASV